MLENFDLINVDCLDKSTEIKSGLLMNCEKSMNNICQKKSDKLFRMRGFSLVEMIIVLLLLAILAAVAIPELIMSRKLWQFAGMKQQIVASLREARQLAISQNRRITLQYNDTTKTLRIFDDNSNITPPPDGGVGPINDSRNKIVRLDINGVSPTDIVYGTPSGLLPLPLTLDDTAIFSCASAGRICAGEIVNVTFNARGDAINQVNGNPANYAFFFYNNHIGAEAAFAISVLGPGGRVRVWAYNGATYE
jgi:prepilin-type N-terminal cleavage/methylation domain-containing protein